MKKIKIMIISLIILIAIIIISLIVIKKINKDQVNNKELFKEEKFDESDIIFNSNDFEYEKYNSNYYGISNIINNLIQFSNMVYNENFSETTGVELTISNKDKQLYVERLLSILSEKYKSKYNINSSNLKNYVGAFVNENYQIDAMYSSLRENGVKIYLVYGRINKSKRNCNFMIVVDSKTNAYEVYLNNYLKDLKYNENEIGNLKIENDNIKLNNYNEFNTRDISDEEMARKYLKDYKQIIQNNLQDAYKMLDNEYKKSRFGSLDKFEEYYKSQVKEFTISTLKKYKVVSNNDYIDYICIDNYDNCFTFRATAVMKYTVFLDEYTIETNEFKEKYKSAANNKKVYANIEKFIKMINAKDYSSAYNVLDEEYKNTNFNTQDDLKNFINNNFYKYNIIHSLGEVSASEDGKYYVCTAIIKDAENLNSEKKEIVFIVTLEEGTKFTIGILE